MSIQQISALARGLKQADPHDVRVRTASLARIDELRTLLARAGCTELVCCLEAATTLIHMTMEASGPQNPGLMDVVAKLVEAVDSAFGYESPHVQKVKAMGDSGLCLAVPSGNQTSPAAEPRTTAPATTTTAHAPATPPTLDMKRASGSHLTLTGGMAERGRGEQRPTTLASNAAKPAPEKPTLPRRAVADTDQPGGAAPLLNDMVFGELMIQLGHITREQLNDGLDHQAAKGGRLGQALIDLNLTSWDVIENVLRFQRMLNPEESGSEKVEESKQAHPRAHRELPNLLGEVVVHLGFTAAEKVEEALRVHRATGIRMG
ncbi:MAG: hypothetical protein KDC14_14580, partial [Planctomycetes bacterium]|nr:hypothetical protein [Planctomycetota bacterium]